MIVHSEQYFEKTLKTCATFLSRWKGARALLRELTVSHKTLRIVLSRGEEGENLVLACIDPLRLHAPITWEHSDISISRIALPDNNGDGFGVTDRVADVEIVCGKV